MATIQIEAGGSGDVRLNIIAADNTEKALFGAIHHSLDNIETQLEEDGSLTIFCGASE